MSDMYTQAHYYISSTCHPWWVTCTHEHTTMTLVHATHSEWHVCMSTLLWLQYMPPTTSDMYTRARHYVSSMCHQQWMKCMQEHNYHNPGQTNPLLIIQRAHKAHVSPLVTCTDSWCYISSICHPRWHVCESTPPCLQYMPLRRWHVCKSTPLSLKYMPLTVSDMYARAQHMRCT